MNAGRLAAAVVGVILFIMGVVFSLQGADVIRGSSPMSGDSSYIYVGGVVAIVGLIVAALAARLGSGRPSAVEPPSP